ncbi:D-alanyl-D-alanine endopeptidase [Noviherbaspirillum agri]
MLKSALRIIVSLCVLSTGIPAAPVQAATPVKASTKKQHVKKSAAKRKVEASTRTAKSRSKTSTASRSNAAKKVAVRGKRQSSYERVAFSPSTPVVPAPATAGDLAGLHLKRDPLELKSNAAFVIDQNTAQVLFDKNSNVALPIASLTKLMTALVVIEARQNMDEVLEVTADDIDRERNSSSRLRVGAQMTRGDMLHIALMSSENRAASALGRHFPGGLPAFVAAMNAKAKMLGMGDTHFVDSTGLSSRNVASARDLAKLVVAAYQHPIIREFSTDPGYAVSTGRYKLNYMNSNRLVKNPNWDIGLQKTGYINEAGRCLVMQARIDGRSVVMVFLDSKGKYSRLADAGRIRKWLEISGPQALTRTASHQG